VTRVLWDVDTQVDFVHADGKLAVPDAESVVPVMARLVSAARAAGVVHIASADDHELTDAEISPEPDYATTYPPHCLRGTRGATKIAETEQVEPVPLALTEVPERWLRGREFLLLKKSFDVFTNPNADRLLALLARGRAVTFVEEASRGLDEQRTLACTASWRQQGVRFASPEEVVAGL
jgi:nicotinamidase-related amidase